MGESSEVSDSEICGEEFSGKFLTNLKTHLKKNHSRVFREFLAKEEEKEVARKRAATSTAAVELTIAETILRNKPYEQGSTRNENITRKLAIFIGAGHVANHLIDCEEFRELLAELYPRYGVPNRTVIEKEMTKVFIELKGKVSTKIKDSRKVSIRMCRHVDKERRDRSFPRYYSTLFHSNRSQAKSSDTGCEKVSVPSYC